MKLFIFTPIRLFGEALTASLNEFEEIEVVGTCHLADRVADRVLELGPDLLLFDMTGERALAEARCVARACARRPASGSAEISATSEAVGFVRR